MTEINVLPAERLWAELSKILLYGSRGILLLEELGLLDVILPCIPPLRDVPGNAFHLEGPVFNHSLLVLDEALKLSNDPIFLLSALLHDVGKFNTYDNGHYIGHEDHSAKVAFSVALKFRLSNEERELLLYLISEHMRIGNIPSMRVSKQRAMFVHPNFEDLLLLHKADCLGRLPRGKSFLEIERLYSDFKSDFKAVSEPSQPSLKDLGICGRMVMEALELEPGPVLGALLKLGLEHYYENPQITKEEMLEYLKNA